MIETALMVGIVALLCGNLLYLAHQIDKLTARVRQLEHDDIPF